MKKTEHEQNHQLSEYDHEPKEKYEVVPHHSMFSKSTLYLSVVTTVLAIITSFFVTSYLDEGTEAEVVGHRTSYSTTAGENIFAEEANAHINARDFEVKGVGTDGGEARMLIWDYNLVDYDEVSVYVNGSIVKEKIILSENAVAISIPVPSKVTITGVKDNGGGINYAVKFPNNEQTYFNVVSVGTSNVYTVLPRP